MAFAGGTATLDATKLTIEALIPATATFSAKSTSGAKGGTTDVAGSLAVNVATVLDASRRRVNRLRWHLAPEEDEEAEAAALADVDG